MPITLKYYKAKGLIAYIIILVGIHSIIIDWFGTLPNWIPSISSLTFVSVLLILYDKFLWRYFPILVKIKNISGRYEGDLSSCYTSDKIAIAVEITQTASYVYIRQFNNDGRRKTNSYSINESFEIMPDNTIRLNFAYRNEGSERSKNINEHKGFCILEFTRDRKNISGIYFTNRNTKGNIELSFISKKKKGRY